MCGKHFVLFLLLMFTALEGYAQDSIALPSIQIVELTPVSKQLHRLYEKNNFSSIRQIDPANISHVFRQQGPGRLLTLRRGALGAEHTKVKWGNLQLGSPLSGIADFSLFPVFLFSNMQSTSEGRQVIQLDDRRYVDQILLGLGTQDFYQFGIKYSLDKNKFRFGVKTYIERAENNYRFINALGEEAKLEQAAHEMQHLIFNAGYKFNDQLDLNGRVWLANNEAELPSALSLNPADQQQRTKSLRSQLVLNNERQKINYSFSVGLISEALEYRNYDSGLKGDHGFRTYQGSLNMQTKSKNWPLKVQLTSETMTGQSSNFDQGSDRNNISLKSEIRGRLLGVNLYGVTQISHVDDDVFYNGRVTLKKDVTNTFSSQLSISKLYRIPTFNELYWLPGGNLDLKPEAGYSVGGLLAYQKRKLQISTELEYIGLKNGIKWQPEAGIWRPQNIDNLRSIQVSTSIKKSLSIKNLSVKITGNYTYTHAWKQSGRFKGDQLVYIPLHKWSIPIQLKQNKQKWGTSLTPSYRGKMYTLEGENKPLESNFLMDFSGYKIIEMFRRETTIKFQLTNITDQAYAWADGYPMPGRRFNLQINYNLNK